MQRTLIVIQLAGGNDGINAVIPYQGCREKVAEGSEEHHHRGRQRLGSPARQPRDSSLSQARHPDRSPQLGEGHEANIGDREHQARTHQP